MNDMTALVQVFGPTGVIIAAAAAGLRYLLPDIRAYFQSQAATNRALTDLAARTDQRLANIEASVTATAADVSVLLDRTQPRNRTARVTTRGAV